VEAVRPVVLRVGVLAVLNQAELLVKPLHRHVVLLHHSHLTNDVKALHDKFVVAYVKDREVIIPELGANVLGHELGDAWG